MIQTLYEVNRKEFSFEEAANPTIPNCRLLFEFGLANAENFNYIDETELREASDQLEKEHFDILDFFCVIRYYRVEGDQKVPLKFDYYFLRTVYNQNAFEIQVHHKKGLRYVSPEDLASFIFNKVNEGSKRKALKRQLHSPS